MTTGQLLDAGLSSAAVKRRVAKGLLHRQHRGVYRLGHRAPSIQARYLAAVLACGERAVLSGASAAFLYVLVRGPAPSPEVTTLANRHLPAVITHRARHLDPRDRTVFDGIPITTVPRTLVDLAARLPLDALARVCHEAQVRYRVNAAAVDAVLARRPKAPGVAKLREIFHGDVPVTLSRLERAFLARLESAGLPPPETNRLVDGRYVDCRWPERRLTVELDSYRYHHTRHAWEQDRRREREARARGDEFRRYTYRDVVEDPGHLLAELRELLRNPQLSRSP